MSNLENLMELLKSLDVNNRMMLNLSENNKTALENAVCSVLNDTGLVIIITEFCKTVREMKSEHKDRITRCEQKIIQLEDEISKLQKK